MTQVIHSHQEIWKEQTYYKQPVCVQCSNKLGKVIRMYVKNNGVFIPYGVDLAQVGDLLVCPVCHIEIIQGFSEILGRSVSEQALESEYAVLKGVQDLPL
jgi:hypothetical protein